MSGTAREDLAVLVVVALVVAVVLGSVFASRVQARSFFQRLDAMVARIGGHKLDAVPEMYVRHFGTFRFFGRAAARASHYGIRTRAGQDVLLSVWRASTMGKSPPIHIAWTVPSRNGPPWFAGEKLRGRSREGRAGGPQYIARPDWQRVPAPSKEAGLARELMASGQSIMTTRAWFDDGWIVASSGHCVSLSHDFYIAGVERQISRIPALADAVAQIVQRREDGR